MTRADLILSLVTGIAVVVILLVLATAPIVHGAPLCPSTTTTTTRCTDAWHPLTSENCPKGPI